MAAKLRVGIELHNLSTQPDSVIRTGIQQVIFNLLEAQHWARESKQAETFEIVPIPMMPLKSRTKTFKDLDPCHLNSSPMVLRAASEELKLPMGSLWAGGVDDQGSPWSDQRFYETLATLDWLVVTGLCEFRHTIERAKLANPKLRVAVLVYDLIPFIRPELTAFGMPEWFTASFLGSLREYADVMFTISRQTALDLVNHRHDLKPQAQVISTPIPPEVMESDVISEKEAAQWLAHRNLARGKYFVCLGTIEPRKNLALAVRGFGRFLKIAGHEGKGFKLIMIGKKGWRGEESRLREEIAEFAEYFVFPGYLPREEIENYIRFSASLIMPSRYEGYGLPISLAKELGTRSITAINSSLPEAAGFSSAFAPVDEPDEMALAMIESARNAQRQGPLPAGSQDEIRGRWRQLLLDWLNELRTFDLGSKTA